VLVKAPASTPVTGVLDADAHVAEVPLQPAERPEFALTNSQCHGLGVHDLFDGGWMFAFKSRRNLPSVDELAAENI
jgi:hypothetical protein